MAAWPRAPPPPSSRIRPRPPRPPIHRPEVRASEPVEPRVAPQTCGRIHTARRAAVVRACRGSARDRIAGRYRVRSDHDDTTRSGPEARPTARADRNQARPTAEPTATEPTAAEPTATEPLTVETTPPSPPSRPRRPSWPSRQRRPPHPRRWARRAPGRVARGRGPTQRRPPDEAADPRLPTGRRRRQHRDPRVPRGAGLPQGRDRATPRQDRGRHRRVARPGGRRSAASSTNIEVTAPPDRQSEGALVWPRPTGSSPMSWPTWPRSTDA